MEFTGRVLVLGCGSVSQCTLPLLLKHLDGPRDRVTILDMVDNRAKVAGALAEGVRYEQEQVTETNMAEVLGARVGPGDLVIDLAWDIDCCAILQWCHDHGVMYVNTSVELWDPYTGMAEQHPLDRTLYVRHMAVRRLVREWDRPGPTAVIEHGANPGLVSHFTKRALWEIGERALREGRAVEGRRRALEHAMAAEAYNLLALELGVKVIHIAERDTQITDRPKEVDEFVNTWSVEGFYEEGITPAELGWGTHEKRMPLGASRHGGEGPGNQICLPQPGIKTWVRSWVPHCEITGMVVRHGEAFTISDHLTVWDGPTPIYRPTVHYAYCPADVALNSLHELEMRRWRLQERQRIVTDEVTSGEDRLGVLLMGHDYKAWWTGSLLSIGETRAVAPHQNATTLQVAASVLGCVEWMIRHPERGVNVPDNLPWREVLDVAYPYLGTFWSDAVDWDPVSTANELYAGFDGRSVDRDDPWQFHNFLV
ncbi:MAG: saccharopine dehydrogenase NADP-binding domain-containing protein [Acidimicrobiales bacterium]